MFPSLSNEKKSIDRLMIYSHNPKAINLWLNTCIYIYIVKMTASCPLDPV